MKIRVENSAPLLDVLEKEFPESTRTHLKKAVRYGCVSLGGAVLKHPDFLLKAGQTVEYKNYRSRETSKFRAPFKILFEDDYVIAVVKPAGILSSGRTTEKVRSMFGMVNKYLLQKTRGKERAYTVHRLDREVSGILLFAKTEEAKLDFQENWSEVEKYYYALVEGAPLRKKGTLQSWLKENSRQVVYSVPAEEEGAKWSVTHYRVLDYYGWEGRKTDEAGAVFTLLQVRLETGRKNQIRVHLSSMGCPIVGDRKYGADSRVKRMVRLYASQIAFPHPVQERRIKLEIPLPANFVYVNDRMEY